MVHARPVPPPLPARERLLAAALETFAEKGYASSSTAEIAAAAKVAEKTLFAHFKTKQALFEATLTPSVLALIEPRAIVGVREVVQVGLTLREVLTALLTDRFAIARRNPKALKLVAQEVLLRPEVRAIFLRTVQEQILPYVTAALADLHRRGELRHELPLPVVLRTIVSIGGGYLVEHYLLGHAKKGSTRGEAKAVAQLVDLLVRAVGTEP